ncbi:MAG: carboxypeptidase M32 [Anaerolineales bacterium]|nr:carboxypeptidase M32 [Anaerolineales bacterium]
MKKKLQELKTRLAEAQDLDRANAVLNWDQSTYMPPGGAEARARQSATLGRLAQEKFTDPAIGKLLDELTPYAESLPYDSDDASLVRVTRREYERMTKVPPAFMGELFQHSAETYQAWTQARPKNDFAAMRPHLEKTLDLSRRLANFFPGYEHIADPLIDFADYGMRASTLRPLFAELRQQQAPLALAILEQPPVDDSCLRGRFSQAKQLAFGRQVVERLGYDFQRGRLDLTHHPFETSFSIGDVRITTRVKQNLLSECLFGCIHESGHGMYEQGIHTALEATPLAWGTSAGVHESQSRLWENVVGRSRDCWEFFYPRLQSVFPKQFSDTPLESFYRAINKVERSLIRVDADEVTYNLHVMIRFDLELALLEGSLAIKDLPEAWNARYQSDLGISAPDDRDGVLQDVHWYAGIIGGAFQGYTLGNILSALFYETALKAHPGIPEQIRQGEYKTLHTWLKDNIYQHGSKYHAPELIERVSGGPIRIEPYIRYLKAKYGEIYAI